MFIFITTNGKYVGMDNASGGYPWITDNPLNAHPWRSTEEARKYQTMFKDQGWILKHLDGLNLSDVND